jgi:hypothetical protein
LVVLIATAVDAALDALVEDAGLAAAEFELELLELPHPATASTAPTSVARPAARNLGSIRLTIILLPIRGVSLDPRVQRVIHRDIRTV